MHGKKNCNRKKTIRFALDENLEDENTIDLIEQDPPIQYSSYALDIFNEYLEAPGFADDSGVNFEYYTRENLFRNLYNDGF